MIRVRWARHVTWTILRYNVFRPLAALIIFGAASLRNRRIFSLPTSFSHESSIAFWNIISTVKWFDLSRTSDTSRNTSPGRLANSVPMTFAAFVLFRLWTPRPFYRPRWNLCFLRFIHNRQTDSSSQCWFTENVLIRVFLKETFELTTAV
jgi:hypothetical protein